jgi:hypothetical protein
MPANRKGNRSDAANVHPSPTSVIVEIISELAAVEHNPSDLPRTGVEQDVRRLFQSVAIKAFVVAATLAACSSGQTGDSTSPGTSSTIDVQAGAPDGGPSRSGTASAPTAEPSLPTATVSASELEELRSLSLEVYAALPIEDDRTLWVATQFLVDQCMSNDGYQYPIEPYPEGTGNLSQITDLYPDDALGAAYGYLWRDHATTNTPPVAPASQNPDPAFQTALGECVATAGHDIGRERLENAINVFYTAASDMSVAVNLEPETEAANDAWVTCMHDTGYNVTSQRAAEDLASNNGTTSLDSPTAVAVAVADFGCQRQVGLSEARLRARQRLVQEWLDANPSAITDRETAIQAVISTCLELVPNALNG